MIRMLGAVCLAAGPGLAGTDALRRSWPAG